MKEELIGKEGGKRRKLKKARKGEDKEKNKSVKRKI